MLECPPQKPISEFEFREDGTRMTWAAQRVQYGLLLKRGYSKDEAKAAMPRCQKCMTRRLAESIPGPHLKPGERRVYCPQTGEWWSEFAPSSPSEE